MNIIETKDKKNIILSGVFTIIFMIVIALLFLNASELKYDEMHGTGIDGTVEDNEYQFSPFIGEESDIIKQHFSPTESGLQSMEIRLATERPDYLKCDILFKIYQKDTEIWNQKIPSENMGNWQYCTLDIPEGLKKGEDYELTIQCIDNSTGVPIKVFLCNMDLQENTKLLFGDELLEGGLDIIYCYNVFPMIKFIMLIFACVLGIGVAWIKNQILNRNSIICVAILLLGSVVCFWMIEKLSLNDVLPTMQFYVKGLNSMMIFALMLILWIMSNHSAVAGIGVTLFSFIAALINHFTLLLRGTVILPSDIFSIRTAYNVAGNYSLVLDKQVLEQLVIITLLILLICKTDRKLKLTYRLGVMLVTVMLWTGIIVLSGSESLEYKMNISVRQDSQTGRSHELGFILNFAENIKYVTIHKPQQYSDMTVQNIYQNLSQEDVKVADEKADKIIVIMNESFADLNYLGDLDTTSEYMKNFYQAADSQNSKIGKCVVSVYGGGTSCSEFEMLTGSSMLFLGAGNAPYQQYIHGKTDSIASYLKEQEYSTYAIHAANPASWNRNVAYPLIGFENFVNETSEAFAEPERCRYWISDQSLVDEMKSIYYTEDDVFEFGLTIQCHGGYNYEDFDDTVKVTNLSKDYDDVNQYLTLIQGTDAAFGDLIEELQSSDENAIVLMFGDHLPGLESEFYQELTGDENCFENQNMALHETPYIFWANYDVDFSDIPDVISANFLSPYLLGAAGVKLDDYYSYLYCLSQKYPVVSRTGIMDADSNIYSYDIDSECYSAIHDYEMVQYGKLRRGTN